MKIGRYLVLSVFFIGLPITFGDRGLLDNFHKKDQLMAIKKTNHQVTLENIALKKNIILLRGDMPFIEKTARNELGMVRRGDLVYRKGQ
jgi:cell division protein FtsB